MCNRYGYLAPVDRLVEEFSQTRVPLRFPKGAIPNIEPRDEISPSESAPIIRAGEHGALLETLSWGWPARGPKARLVINIRSEGRGFERGRCLIPATHFFEFTGTKYPKTRWRLTKADEDMFCIAGQIGGEGGSAFSMITVAPGPDILPFHDRQVAIIERRDWADWLDGSSGPDLLGPLPAGALTVAEAPRQPRLDLATTAS